MECGVREAEEFAGDPKLLRGTARATVACGIRRQRSPTTVDDPRKPAPAARPRQPQRSRLQPPGPAPNAINLTHEVGDLP